MGDIEARKREEIEFHNKVYRDSNSFARELKLHEKILVGNVYSTFERDRAFLYYRSVIEKNAAGKQILDIGCGNFDHSRFLARLDAQVTAVDLSDAGIASAKLWAKKERVSNVEFMIMDVENLDFDDSSFDIVCGASILHHVDTMRTIAEVNRVLKPGGYAIFLDTMGHNPLFNLFRKITPHGRTSYEHPLHVKDIRQMSAYFEDVAAKYFQMLSYAAIPFSKIGKHELINTFGNLDDALFRAFPFLGKYASNVVITLKKPKK